MTPANPRKRIHTRRFHYECYLRDDGLWDIDAELSDVKDYAYTLHSRSVQADEPTHHMQIRITVDETLLVKDIVTRMEHVPYSYCRGAIDPMRTMIGVKMGSGWRNAINERLGGVNGCTHLRDLLFNAGTAAIQSIAAYARFEGRVPKNYSAEQGRKPHFIGKCMTWNLSGPVVKQWEPSYYVPPTVEPDQGK